MLTSAAADSQTARKSAMRRAVDLLSVAADQGRAVREAELRNDLLEIDAIQTIAEGDRGPSRIDATPRVDLFDEPDVEAELLQAQQPAQADPGLAAVVRLVGQGPGDNDRFHGQLA